MQQRLEAKHAYTVGNALFSCLCRVCERDKDTAARFPPERRGRRRAPTASEAARPAPGLQDSGRVPECGPDICRAVDWAFDLVKFSDDARLHLRQRLFAGTLLDLGQVGGALICHGLAPLAGCPRLPGAGCALCIARLQLAVPGPRIRLPERVRSTAAPAVGRGGQVASLCCACSSFQHS